METQKTVRKAAVSQKDCVACGCCVKVCPKSAIRIVQGVFAEVNAAACVGCGRCVKECPAAVIAIAEVSA